MKISACIIGLNEEKKIADCFESVQSIADEIIFVDSLSIDGTVKIAKQYGARIISQEFLGYSKQKNLAIDHARYNWILNLDCDERLSEKAISDIQKFKIEKKDAIENEDIRAVSFNRLTYYIYRWIRHSGWYPDTKIRLFNKKFCRWVGENLHERIDCPNQYTYKINANILHYSYDSISDHIKTIDSYSTIGAREAFKKGKQSNLFTIVLRSFWAGFKKFFFKMAFLDGVAGIILTGLSIAGTWSKYSKLYILNLENKKKSNLQDDTS